MRHSNCTVPAAALASTSFPFLLVATKCDVPENQRQIDTTKMATIAAAYPSCIGNYRTSANAPASQRDCLQVMLKAALGNGKGERPHRDVGSRHWF